MQKNENGYVILDSGKFQHREVYFSKFPKVDRRYEIHHINKKRDDNRLGNLVALPKPVHKDVHFYIRKLRRNLKRKEIKILLVAHFNGRDNRKVEIWAEKQVKKRTKKKKISKKLLAKIGKARRPTKGVMEFTEETKLKYIKTIKR